MQQLREERDKAQSVVNTSDSLLTAEQAAQERLAQQLKQLEAEHLALQGDLGFFERMFPPSGSDKRCRPRACRPSRGRRASCTSRCW